MKNFTTLLFITLILITELPVLADELIMQNGDRLSGEVISKDDKILKFKTSYGGPFDIAWDQVKELRSDSPMTILKEGGVVSKSSEIKNLTEPDKQAQYAKAYINPPSWRLGKGYDYSGIVNAALQADRGNTKTDEFDFDAKISLRSLKNRFTLFGELENDESDDIKTKDKWLGTAKYDRFFNKRFYGGAVTTLSRDKFADLNSRFGVGPLVGYQFYEGKQMNLSAEWGPIWVMEDFATQADEEYWANGWKLNFDRYLLTDLLQLYHRQHGLWGIEDTGKLILETWTGLKIPIFAGIVTSGEVKVEYESEPAPGAKNTDTSYALKLGYEW